jgi:prevent-host-death family protein
LKIERERVWTVAEAKARLSEILRLAQEEGPQRIGTKRRFVIVPEEEWQKHAEQPLHIGQWLLKNMPRIDDLELPDRAEPERPPLFSDIEPYDFEGTS